MAATTTGSLFLSTGTSVINRRNSISVVTNNRNLSTRRFAATSTGEEEETSTATTTTTLKTPLNSNYSYNKKKKKSLKDYFDESRDFIDHNNNTADGGLRWFTPVDCGPHNNNNNNSPPPPLLLYLPGIDGVGLGLIRQHHTLGMAFDVWCLHIPVKDRTPFKDLVKLVETTVRSENRRAPNRPIYLVGDSIGGCIALEVAARNSDIDLVLILANPATSFGISQLHHLVPLLQIMPDQLQLHTPYALSLFTGLLSSSSSFSFLGDPLKRATDDVKGFILQQTVGLPHDLTAIPSYLSVVADILPKETLIWKLKLLRSASAQANSHLHAVKAETLILSSGKDQLLSSEEESKRLLSILPICEIRNFQDSGHFLFLEDDVNLLSTIKGANFYRRGKEFDCVRDFMPPTLAEFNKIYEENRLLINLMNPVMLSTLEDGTVVKGLAGIPTEGPVLFVGYHMLLGLELHPMVIQFFKEKNILMRGIAHPLMFDRKKDGPLPDRSNFDKYRIMGAVPVSGTNFFKLLSSKSHVLLYPGGGEEYKLFWPERSEFVRMAARFGAKIVPFGAVGEDDLAEVVVDYDDLMKMSYFRDQIEQLSEQTVNVRSGEEGEVANQQLHMPWILPKPPGRFYYYFGKPIETAGRKKELKDRENAHELYLEVKSEVEKLIGYLKEKREHDPYRSIVARTTYQATHGFTSDVPSFEL
ncbi:hypothetical protein ACFE04_009299 [Oxalis oulophora]